MLAAVVKILATRRYPGPAFDQLEDVEVAPLSSLESPRDDVEGLIVANEPVPLELLQVVPARPQVWSVVPRPLDAVDMPLSWGNIYAVCPNCCARAPLGQRVPSMPCTRCGGEFEIAWSLDHYLA